MSDRCLASDLGEDGGQEVHYIIFFKEKYNLQYVIYFKYNF